MSDECATTTSTASTQTKKEFMSCADESEIDGLQILQSLKLASYDHLTEQKRLPCPQCNKNMKYFCYDCCEVIGDRDKVPRVELPIKLEIVYHPQEKTSKATSIHAKVLAGHETVALHTYPAVPEFDEKTDVLLYPTNNAVLLDEMSKEDILQIKRVVVLDSQWNNARVMEKHENLKKLRRVKIRTYSTTFWRYQSMGKHCLATIEAIYYFYREYATAVSGTYNGEYDNLLYYYWFFYNLIQHTYKEKDSDFRVPFMQNYIKRNAAVAIDAVKKMPVPAAKKAKKSE